MKRVKEKAIEVVNRFHGKAKFRDRKVEGSQKLTSTNCFTFHDKDIDGYFFLHHCTVRPMLNLQQVSKDNYQFIDDYIQECLDNPKSLLSIKFQEYYDKFFKKITKKFNGLERMEDGCFKFSDGWSARERECHGYIEPDPLILSSGKKTEFCLLHLFKYVSLNDQAPGIRGFLFKEILKYQEDKCVIHVIKLIVDSFISDFESKIGDEPVSVDCLLQDLNDKKLINENQANKLAELFFISIDSITRKQDVCGDYSYSELDGLKWIESFLEQELIKLNDQQIKFFRDYLNRFTGSNFANPDVIYELTADMNGRYDDTCFSIGCIFRIFFKYIVSSETIVTSKEVELLKNYIYFSKEFGHEDSLSFFQDLLVSLENQVVT